MPSFSARAVQIAVLACLTACASATSIDSTPAGPDTTTPFPIDRGGDGAAAPGTYKALPLQLFDNGAPSVTAVGGIIGLVCVGMSNANQECNDYLTRARTEFAAEINTAVRIVNCAVGGNAIERWNDAAYDANLWNACINQRLPQAGVRLDQVRVIYHKAANQFTTGAGGAALPLYPNAGSDYLNFVQNLTTFAGRVKAKFPAVQAVYTTSRSYGGFAGSAARGEPLSYEEGHALNTWLASNRVIDGVWYGWGPYIWAPACSTGITNKGGVCFNREDYVADGVHPSALGQAKVSRLIHARFREHSWYR